MTYRDPEAKRAYQKAYYQRNAVRLRAMARAHWRGSQRWTALKTRYGITRAEFERLEAEQGGTCRLCHRPTQRLVVDHDHETGRIRGLLCNRCNVGLPMVEDKLRLARAMEYLSPVGVGVHHAAAADWEASQYVENLLAR